MPLTLILCYGFVIILTALGCIFLALAFTDSTALLIKIWQFEPLHFEIALRIDSFANICALSICWIGALIFLYSSSYLKSYSRRISVICMLGLFAFSMLLTVLADNLILVFIAWELTSIFSYALISTEREKPEVRMAALSSLLITAGGGLGLLILAILSITFFGAASFSELEFYKDQIIAHPWSHTLLLLASFAAFSKSAQFPFSSWLPRAMAAPSPVSAYLHSATMVTLGVYLLVRLFPIFGSMELWTILLCTIGGLSFLVAGIRAFIAEKIKTILAHTTVSALGLMVLMLGIGSPYSVKAALVFYIVHALYKSSLFMLAGDFAKFQKSNTLQKLEEVDNFSFSSKLACILALAAMVGLPPLLAFISKELLIEATLNSKSALLLTALLIIANGFVTACALTIGWSILKPKKKKRKKHSLSPVSNFSLLTFPALILGILGIIFGVLAQEITEPILAEAYFNLIASDKELDLKLWHGFNFAFAVSTATLVFAAFLAIYRKSITKLKIILSLEELFLNGQKYFDFVVYRFSALCKIATSYFQTGKLTDYLVLNFIALACVLAVGAVTHSNFDMKNIIFPSEALLIGALLIIAGSVIILNSDSRAGGILSLALVGLGTTVVFVCSSAIDLALTQILVETLTLVIFVFIAIKVPKKYFSIGASSSAVSHFIALLIGASFAFLHMMALRSQESTEISEYYLTQSIPQAFGGNVVNVILVDFRSFDTFGEVLVLCIAALGVLALIRIIPQHKGNL